MESLEPELHSLANIEKLLIIMGKREKDETLKREIISAQLFINNIFKQKLKESLNESEPSDLV